MLEVWMRVPGNLLDSFSGNKLKLKLKSGAFLKCEVAYTEHSFPDFEHIEGILEKVVRPVSRFHSLADRQGSWQ